MFEKPNSAMHRLRNEAEAEAAATLFCLHTSPICPPKRSQLSHVPELDLPQSQVKYEDTASQQAKSLLGGFKYDNNNSSVLSSSAPAAAAGTLMSLMAIAEAGKNIQEQEEYLEDQVMDSKENFGVQNLKSESTPNRARTLSLMSIDEGDCLGFRKRGDSVCSIQSEPGHGIPERFLAAHGNGKMIGAYSPASRRKLLDRFLEKRRNRIWKKRIKYGVRKNFADSRLRVKGRFVRKEDEEQLREFLLMTI